MFGILQSIFDSFGEKPVGRIIACGLIAGIVTLFSTWKNGVPSGSWVDWALMGVGMGIVAGLVLTWPRLFAGCLFSLAGLFVLSLVIIYRDSEEIDADTITFLLIVGSILGAIGLFFLYWAYNRTRSCARHIKNIGL